MPPPTRREQLELDELLSDIYRGIETLPDKSTTNQIYSTNNNHFNTQNKSSTSGGASNHLFARSYVKEYELPASSPTVKQHKQELAALRDTTNSSSSPLNNHINSRQPQRSTLKRQTTSTPEQRQQPQSLASFVTSTTPENRRRVRIVDHPDKLAKEQGVVYSSDEADYEANQRQNYKSETGAKQQTNVKYVNTNKLIYHQEQNPDDEPLSDTNSLLADQALDNNSQLEDGDDIDGVTRVEYYHTTWLDRQLGRASKRRSSKELNERQVKEKAMIEELKRSLKNGAITLRQSFKGKKNSGNKSANNNHNKPSETYDDQMIESGKRVKESTIFGSGLATIPRNYHHQNRSSSSHNNSNTQQQYNKLNTYHQGNSNNIDHNNKYINSYHKEDLQSRSNTLAATPKQTTSDFKTNNSSTYKPNNFDSCYQPVTANNTNNFTLQSNTTAATKQPLRQQEQQANYSKTLPHNYQPKKVSGHQLLQSHYRGGDNKINSIINKQSTNSSRPIETNINSSDEMRQYNGNSNKCAQNNYGQVKSPTFNNNNQQQQFQNDHQQQNMNTISSIPSATEVVRTALSRSSSQVSLNQLNKTINLLPNSPPPYGPSPMTPTHQLKPASPSLSPSPTTQHQYNQQHPTPNARYSSKTMGHQNSQQQQQQQQNQNSLYGTRTTGRVQPHHDGYQQQQQQQHPVYANPHASLMQHKLDQQANKSNVAGGRNTASIREFNELDSLLRSLSPASSVQITPGYNSKPAQPSFGYGFTPAAPQQQQQQQQQQHHQPINSNKVQPDIYARVQKPATGGNEQQNLRSNYPQQQQQQHYAPNNNIQAAPFTIDVTNKRPEDCLKAQELSEFEPPIELLPSMEDYQNISKLNPVKNHYWYKPNMSRDRAISLLKDKPQGTFIVRDSTSFRGAFGLAVKVSKLPKNIPRNPNADPSTELIRHFLIEPTSNGVQLKGYANEPVFGSLPSLIYQHSLTELALPCKLLIPRADIEDQRFNQKQKQFYDEFIASKEQAKHNPYDRTSPNGGYRKYPGDVYVHNEHRIIFQ